MTSSGPVSLATADRYCRTVIHRHASTFSVASRLLPVECRRGVHALYALARLADDLVDLPVPGSDPSSALEQLAQRFSTVVASGGDVVDLSGDDGATTGLVLLAAAETVRRHDIPLDCFERFFRSMRLDLSIDRYDTWDDLLDYMDGSAAAIGEMLLPLLDPVDRSAALAPARSLGLAFQFTNFLRDVAEDLDRGRQYLPQDDLRRFGVELGERRVDDDFRALMRFEIERCRGLYRDARPGLALLPSRTRPAIAVAHDVYGAILDRIEDIDFDVFAQRARVPRNRRLRTIGRVLVGGAGRGRR